MLERSYLYKNICKDKFVIKYLFPRPATVDWLNRATKELELVEKETYENIEGTNIDIRDRNESNKKACDSAGALESEDQVALNILDNLFCKRKERYH